MLILRKKRHRPHQHVSHSSSPGVKQKRRTKTNVSVGAKSTGGGVMPPGIAGGGGRKLTFFKVQHLALLYLFWLGTDLDLPQYGSPLNPITISFHDYTIIFSLSNGIKALEPPDRSFFLIHHPPKNALFDIKTHFFAKKHMFSPKNVLLQKKIQAVWLRKKIKKKQKQRK